MKSRDLICAYERAGSAMGTSRLPSKILPNPQQQSPNVVASVRNNLSLRESPLKTGGFNVHGKVMGSPAELKPIAPAIGRGWYACSPTAEEIGWYCLPARKGTGAEKGCGCWYGSGYG